MKLVETTSALQLIMPDSSQERRDLLLPHLASRPERPLSPSFNRINEISMPDGLDSNVRFDYSLREIVEIAKNITSGSPDDLKRVIRYALIWSGLKLNNDTRINWAVLDHGYEPESRLSRIITPIDAKRLSIRIVPDSWNGSYSTPFTLHKTQDGMKIYALENNIPITIAAPNLHYMTESVQALAYFKTMNNGATGLTINPLQKCPQECGFCCRAYYDMTNERKAELLNLRPEEIARYLKLKFPHINQWEDISEITIVTGEFANSETLLKYIEKFTAEMRVVTNDQWDPLKNPHQEITISSHLLQTHDSMIEAKKLGMKHYYIL